MVMSKFLQHYAHASERVREAGGEMPAASAASAPSASASSKSKKKKTEPVAVPPPAQDDGFVSFGGRTTAKEIIGNGITTRKHLVVAAGPWDVAKETRQRRESLVLQSSFVVALFGRLPVFTRNSHNSRDSRDLPSPLVQTQDRRGHG